MTDKYCPLRFREYDSNPHDQRCIGDDCAWFSKCSQSHGEPIYGMPYGNMEPWQAIATEEPQEPREADENANDEDTRAKLEADVRAKCEFDNEWVNFVTIDEAIGWLDRQMALTSREWSGYLNEAIEQLNEASAERDELQEQLDKLSSDELHWHSEADFWKRKYELICKALIDLNRNYVHVEDEGLA